MGEERGSIAFFSTYRPPVPLDIFASPINPQSGGDEILYTDGKSYNYNGREIPPGALKTLLNNTIMGDRANARDVDNGDVTGIVFVSERTKNLETLHFAIRSERRRRVKVYNFGELYDTGMTSDVRMEDSGCFAGNRYFIFVSTYEDSGKRRQPWNAVYRTDLRDGETIRLTPEGVADFSPSVSPSGRYIAVATLEGKQKGWDGEIEDLKTNIITINVRDPEDRELVVVNGGWPSWGSDDVIFFHRAQERQLPQNPKMKFYRWGVFRAEIQDGIDEEPELVTPENVDAMTPAAIDSYRVAVAIIREKLDLAASRNRPQNYRHIAVFDITKEKPLPVTRRTNNYVDHYNPFVIRENSTGDVLIGYNRTIGELERGEVGDQIDRLEGDDPDEVGVVRVPGVFPTFTRDGRKLAFVDNDFQNVYLADIEDQDRPRPIFSVSELQLPENEKSLFSPVWNQDEGQDILYVCVGPAFSSDKQVHIYAIFNASDDARRRSRKLTTDGSNNAFPSTNPDGNMLVFRSTRDWVGKRHNSPVRPKNLYIMDARRGDRDGVTRVTSGDWIDTHCQWSPNGDWIVYSSTCDKPRNNNAIPDLDNGLDPGYYSIYLIRSDHKPNMRPVRVIRSDRNGAGHVNHPMFSPDGSGLVFAADLAGVSVEPISLPLFVHSVRPYGDIFRVDFNNPDDIHSNKDITDYIRVTHSRYENSTPHWTCLTTDELSGEWKELFRQCEEATWGNCPFSGSSWKANSALTGQLGLSKRCC